MEEAHTTQGTRRWAVAVQATDRAEDETCERGTQGCSVNHTLSDERFGCETW